MIHLDVRCQRCGVTLPLPIDAEGCKHCANSDKRKERELGQLRRGFRTHEYNAHYWEAFAMALMEDDTAASIAHAHAIATQIMQSFTSELDEN